MSRKFVVLEYRGKNGHGSPKVSESIYSGTPVAAAKKAHTKKCSDKSKKGEIKGRCAYNINVQEIETTPAGSPVIENGKYVVKKYKTGGKPVPTRTYHVRREKYKPNEKPKGLSYDIEYKTVAVAIK